MNFVLRGYLSKAPNFYPWEPAPGGANASKVMAEMGLLTYTITINFFQHSIFSAISHKKH